MPEYDIEKTGFKFYEKLIYFFLVPVFFSIIITLVLLAFFDYNVMGAVMNTANRIPLVKQWVPDPVSEDEVEVAERQEEDLEAINEQLRQQLEELQQQLQQQLVQHADEVSKKAMQIEELQQEVSFLSEELQEKRLTQEEYLQHIRQLSNMYGNMSSSKAAAIIENLTSSERVLILNEMNNNKRGAILERMNPAVAAETSMHLKDLVPVEDLEMAALQERLELERKDAEPATDALGTEELAVTLQEMSPSVAAGVLIQMYDLEQDKVIRILRTMASQGRASILSSIAEKSETKAADIINRLGN